MSKESKETSSNQEPNSKSKVPKASSLRNPSLGNRVVINVSGLRYETYDQTLERFPESLLGNRQRREKFYDHEKKEYFFDKNRICFESILAYYQTCGVLIRPPNIPRKVFVSNLKFFDLGEDALRQAGDDLDIAFTPESRPMPKNKIQRKIWSIFEHPDTSNWARAMAIFSITIIVLSIVLFCVETLPQFQPKNQRKSNTTAGNEKPVPRQKQNSAFFVIEAFCIAWFTLEYTIRLLCCPNKWKFVVSVLNIIDLIAIIPFFITLPMKEPTSVSSLAILRCVRLVRVFRIFKLSRYSRGLQILGHTLKASLRELGLLFFFLCVGVILFSSAVYYAEFGSSPTTEFRSIPHSFWWSIITMTTVGYGDMVPKTLGGKLVGCFCAITGVLAIALPVPVIVSNFAYYYSREHSRGNNGDNDDDDAQTETKSEDKAKDVESGDSPVNKFACFGKRRLRSRKSKKKEKKKGNEVSGEIEMDLKNGNVRNKEKKKKNDQTSKSSANTQVPLEKTPKKDSENNEQEDETTATVTDNKIFQTKIENAEISDLSGHALASEQDPSLEKPETNV